MSWIILIWLAVSVPSPGGEANGAQATEPCRLKVNINTQQVQCVKINCGGDCDDDSIQFGGKTYITCLCDGGETYQDVCKGKAIIEGGTMTLECTAVESCQDCQHEIDAQSNFRWCTCQ